MKDNQENVNNLCDMEALKRLSAEIAHDFNNVLTGIMGFNQLILMEMSENDKFYHDLKEIDKASEKGKLLTEQLNSFKSTIPRDIEKTDINMLVEERLGKFLKALKGGIKIDAQPGSIPSIECDPIQVYYAIKNSIIFLNKVIEVSRIEIKTEEIGAGEDQAKNNDTLEKGQKYILISVIGNGKMIVKEDPAIMLDPVESLKKFKIAGLGLCMTQEIAINHGGAFALASEGNEKMTAKIWLPIK